MKNLWNKLWFKILISALLVGLVGGAIFIVIRAVKRGATDPNHIGYQGETTTAELTSESDGGTSGERTTEEQTTNRLMTSDLFEITGLDKGFSVDAHVASDDYYTTLAQILRVSSYAAEIYTVNFCDANGNVIDKLDSDVDVTIQFYKSILNAEGEVYNVFYINEDDMTVTEIPNTHTKKDISIKTNMSGIYAVVLFNAKEAETDPNATEPSAEVTTEQTIASSETTSAKTDKTTETTTAKPTDSTTVATTTQPTTETTTTAAPTEPPTTQPTQPATEETTTQAPTEAAYRLEGRKLYLDESITSRDQFLSSQTLFKRKDNNMYDEVYISASTFTKGWNIHLYGAADVLTVYMPNVTAENATFYNSNTHRMENLKDGDASFFAGLYGDSDDEKVTYYLADLTLTIYWTDRGIMYDEEWK